MVQPIISSSRLGLAGCYGGAKPRQRRTLRYNMTKQERDYNVVLAKINNNIRVPLLKVIRNKCLECCCFDQGEVKGCEITDCVLHKFRMGKHPIKRQMTTKQREKQREIMKKRFGRSS